MDYAIPAADNITLLHRFDSVCQAHGAYGLSNKQMRLKDEIEKEILSRMNPKPKPHPPRLRNENP